MRYTKIPSEKIKQRLAAQYDMPFSGKFSRFLEALLARLTRTEYGPDGLLFVCKTVFADPAIGLDVQDSHDILRRLNYDAIFVFDYENFHRYFQEGIDLLLRTAQR